MSNNVQTNDLKAVSGSVQSSNRNTVPSIEQSISAHTSPSASTSISNPLLEIIGLSIAFPATRTATASATANSNASSTASPLAKVAAFSAFAPTDHAEGQAYVPHDGTHAVKHLSFSLFNGETVAIVGESGCGKSVTALAIMRLLDAPGVAISGEVRLQGTNLLALNARAMRAVRGQQIAMIFQDPMSALNPVMSIGQQLVEAICNHQQMPRSAAWRAAQTLLERVRIPEPTLRLREFPHQLSGGMRQRVAIAIAIAGQPKILIADEPTTALDVTIQAQILQLLGDIQRETGMSLILITHDLGVVAETADRVVVMYGGQKVEEQTVTGLFSSPKHAYTQSLIAARLELHTDGIPSDGTHGAKIASAAVHASHAPVAPKLLEVDGLSISYHTSRGSFRAVNNVSFAIERGTTLGLVGESGCGKSSIAKALVRLTDPDSGQIRLDGQDIVPLKGAALKLVRPRIQIVFQDPMAALDPRRRIGDAIGDPLALLRKESKMQRQQRVADLMEQVGLSTAFAARLPHQLSGGQRQRVVIARALALEPDVLICDEPLSALDVSLQAKILELLSDIQRKRAVSYLLVSHDLSVVQHLSDRVAVMYLGEIVEIGGRDSFWRAPAHPYTQALIAVVPSIRAAQKSGASTIEANAGSNPGSNAASNTGASSRAGASQRASERVLEGDVPSPFNPPSGCRFRTRCPYAMEHCALVAPPLIEIEPDHAVACHLFAKKSGNIADARALGDFPSPQHPTRLSSPILEETAS